MTIAAYGNTETLRPENEDNPLAALALKKMQEDLLRWVQENFTAAKNARLSYERQWSINEAFYTGRQNIAILAPRTQPYNYVLTTPKAPPWRVRLIVNKIRPIVRTHVAKLTSNSPTAYVVPTSADEADVMAARVTENIWEAAYRELNIDTITHDVAWWASVAGTAFYKTYWDPAKGPQVMTPVGLNPDGSPLMMPQQAGDTCIESIDPYHIFVPDVAEREIESQPFVIHAMSRNVINVNRYYGEDFEAQAKASDPFAGGENRNNNSRLLKEVPAYEVWLKPDAHKEFPEGGLITVIGEKVVQLVKGFPYSHKQFPFAKVEDVQSNKFYADSIINDLLPLQREYNRTRSQIIEAKNLMAKPRLMAPRGSVNPRMITSEPGQVILYTPGFTPPTPLPMDSLPPYVLEELDRIQQDIDDISGQHEISRGQNPSQVTAASALTYLNEQDESKLSFSIASLERAIEKVARQYLTFVKDYWTEPRTVKVVGKNQAFESHIWRNEDMKGNIDLRVEAGSALPQSKAARQAYLMDLYKMGALMPEQMFEALDMKGLEKAFDDMLIDRRQAQRENLKFVELADIDPAMLMQPAPMQPPDQAPLPGMEGPPGSPQQQPMLIPPELAPNSYDNHEAHVHYHNQFRKTQEFEQLPDHCKQIMEQHVTMHQQTLMMGMQPAMGGPAIGGPAAIDPAQQMSGPQENAIQEGQ